MSSATAAKVASDFAFRIHLQSSFFKFQNIGSFRIPHVECEQPIHEMPGAASASVRDLTPHGGVTNSNWSGGVQKKVGGVVLNLVFFGPSFCLSDR